LDDAKEYAGRVAASSVHPGVIVTGLHREDKTYRPWFYAAYVAAVRLPCRTPARPVSPAIPRCHLTTGEAGAARADG
jgi:hypothetical protein